MKISGSRIIFSGILSTAVLLSGCGKDEAESGKPAMPMITFHTSMGDIRMEIDAEKAPITAANFVQYANEGFFDGTIFHRVIPGFVIQGGGFTADMQQKLTRDPIKNEAINGLKNLRGTISMARTSDPNSATSQFFINLQDNGSLDPGGGRAGYAVFGKVVKGMDVVDKIAAAPTGNRSGHRDVPRESIVVQKVSIKMK